MTALADERATKGRNLGAKREYKMADDTTIYAGGMVMINSAGLAIAAAPAANNKGVVGVATATVTNPSGGTKFVEVQEGEFLFAGDTLEQADVGGIVYADDDNIIDETQASNAPIAGKLVEYVGASEGWVAIGLALAS